MSTTTSKYAQPILAGGAVMGVLSALPFINLGNLCCCLWVISGGLVAAFLLQQNDTTPITVADGALVGVLSGITGAMIYLAVSIPISFLTESLMRRAVVWLLAVTGQPAPDLPGASGVVGRAVGLFLSFIIMLFIGTLFSTLGGILGAAIFRTKPAAPAVIDIPPSS